MISNQERLRRAFSLVLPKEQATIASDPDFSGWNANNHGVDPDILSALQQPMTDREKRRVIYGQL